MKRFFASLAALMICLVLSAPAASAAGFNIFDSVDCSKGENSKSAVCSDKSTKDPISGKNGVLLDVVDIVAFVAGAAAVIIIIVSSIRYITANGDSNNIGSAKNGIIYALIGLVVIVLARILINYVLNNIL